jgi:hypothetical protein
MTKPNAKMSTKSIAPLTPTAGEFWFSHNLTNPVDAGTWWYETLLFESMVDGGEKVRIQPKTGKGAMNRGKSPRHAAR